MILTATHRMRSYRRSRVYILVIGACLSGCMTRPVTPSFTFNPYEIVTSSARAHQTLLTGFLLGGEMAELAVVSLEGNDDRSLRIYAFSDDSWKPRLDRGLRPDVLFVDVANIGGRDRLVTYEPGRLNWFDPKSGTEQELVAVTSNFNPPRSGEIPHVDVTRDVNGDDRDDLVAPDVDGFWVFIQLEGGRFADPVKIGPSTGTSVTIETDGYRYTPWDQGRVYEIDYNLDGRRDLVYWSDDHFKVHYQGQDGRFDPVAATFTTDVAFDSDDLTTLAAPHGLRQRRKDHMPTGALTGRVLHALTDMNRDGVADLGIFSLLGGDLWRMHVTYEVHFGTSTPHGVVFAPDVGAAIQLDGLLFGIEQHVFDHGGQLGMTFRTLKPSMLKVASLIAGWFLTGSVPMDIQFYRMYDNAFPGKPNTSRKLKTYPGDSGEKTVWPSVLIGDVNGDRHSDLLVQHGWNELRIYPGVPGPDLFAKRPQKVAVAMPKEEYTWLVDLNKDAKQDVLIHHPSTTEPHRVMILMAQ